MTLDTSENSWATLTGRLLGHAGTLLHEFLKIREVFLVNPAGGGVVALADSRGHADHLTHHATSAHDPYRAEGLMSHADVAPGHEQVADVAAV